MREWIQARVATGGFSSASDYVRSLVCDDQERAAEERLEALLLEGLESESRQMTQDDWRDIRRVLRERVTTRTPSPTRKTP
jgi:antitoxin ParD1/3/4